MTASGHVVEYQAAIAVYRIDHFLHRAEAGDDDGHALFDADRQIRLQAWIAAVHDQVDRIRRGLGLQAGFDLFQPGLEGTAVALVERRKAANDAVAATGQDQLRVGHQEHGGGHHGQAQTLFEQGGKAHTDSLAGTQKGLTTTRMTTASRTSTGASLNQR
ncbi:hypothetical protein FQZ97_922430 [compost metagenome]